MKLDLQMWWIFLESPQCYSRPFMEFGHLNATDINLFSDVSKLLKTGRLGAICDLE